MSTRSENYASDHVSIGSRRLACGLVMAGVVVLGGLGFPSVQARVETTVASTQSAAVSATRSKPEVQPELFDLLDSGKQAQFAIFLERPDLEAAHRLDWNSRGQFVFDVLTEAAERLQAPLRDHLRASGYEFQHFWVDNLIVVDNGDLRLLEDLSLFEGVRAVRALPEVRLIEPEPARLFGALPPGPIPNLVRIKVPEAWAAGARGQGMVVASIDTGVRFTHVALVEKYRGHLGGGAFDHNYNFFNPYSAAIGDSDGHGSHVTGTMVGGTAGETIGVAPDAQWIACRGFNPNATGSGLLACAQWVAAPTDLNGNNPDPDLRPHAVNNSWGDCGTSYDSWYQGVVNTWVAAGIVPLFANGNASNCGYPSPPGLNTVGNPGRYGTVMGIGSTGNSNGQYANHSNWGPTDNPNPGLPTYPDHFGFPNIKPNVMAPGVAIRSSTRTSDTSYANFSGTSMSSPHVAGLVALMWSAAPCLIGNYAATGTIMMQTAVAIPYATGGSPPPGPGNVPNYATGWGEIDAEAAVVAAIAACGGEQQQGTIAGTVTDSSTNMPIEGVQVIVINPSPPPPSFESATDESGNYSLDVAEGSGYEVHFSRFGYMPASVTGVDVIAEQTTTVDMALDPASTVTVFGHVIDADTGWGLHAMIEIAGLPDGPVWTDPVSGAYSIDLVAGSEFIFSVSTEIPGYVPMARSVGPLAGDQVEDFALEATSDCSAPGRSAGMGIGMGMTEHFEGSFPPAGWVVSSLGGAAACVWRRNDQLVNQFGAAVAPRPNFAGGDGFSAAADSDRCGRWSRMHAALRSPSIDLTALVNPVLEYVVSYRHLGGSRLFTEISTNGGANWTILEALSADLSALGPGAPRSFDLTPFANASDAMVRFRYRAPNWDWWGQVDQVRVRGTACNVPTGGLVVGIVSDENTMQGLNGAEVDAGGGVSSSYASADPALGAGFYVVYAPLSSTEVSADGSPVHPGYGIVTEAISVIGGETQRVDLDVPAASLTVDPESVTKNLGLGQTGTENVALINSGSIPVMVDLRALSAQQEDFEEAFPPDGWTATNGPGATPHCGWRRNDQWGLPNYAGDEGFAAAVNSDACGQGTQTRALLTSPIINLSLATKVQLDFELSYRHLPGANNFLRLEVSSNGGASWSTIETYTASVSALGPGTPQSFDLVAQLAGASQAQYRFYYSGNWAWWALIDQVRLTADVPWLSIDPSIGVLVPPNDEVQVELQFDASQVPSVGTYMTSLVVEHDTPYSVALLPITMHVTEGAGIGEIKGTVIGLGYCDAVAVPLGGADVTIVSQADTYRLVTGTDGAYSLFLDAAESPIDISVSAPQHQTVEREGRVVSTGGVSTEDFNLHLDAPCASVAPSHLDASRAGGGSTSQVLSLNNAVLSLNNAGAGE